MYMAKESESSNTQISIYGLECAEFFYSGQHFLSNTLKSTHTSAKQVFESDQKCV